VTLTLTLSLTLSLTHTHTHTHTQTHTPRARSNDAPALELHRATGVSRLRFPLDRVLSAGAGEAAAMDLITRAFAGAAEVRGRLGAATLVGAQAERAFVSIGDEVERAAVPLFVLVLTLPLPLFLSVAAGEAESGLAALSAGLGVSRAASGCVAAALNACLYAVTAGAFALAGGRWGLRLRTLSDTSPALLALTFGGQGAALVGAGALLGPFTRTRAAASVASVLFAVLTPLLACTVVEGVFFGAAAGGAPLPEGLLWLPVLGPQLALARVLHEAMYAAVTLRAPLADAAAALGDGPALRDAVLALWLGGVAACAAGLCLEPYAAGEACPRPCARGGGGARGARAAAAASGGGGPFAHLKRWAAAAGLSDAAAARAYARGEDCDVHRERCAAAVAEPAATQLLLRGARVERPLVVVAARAAAAAAAAEEEEEAARAAAEAASCAAAAAASASGGGRWAWGGGVGAGAGCAAGGAAASLSPALPAGSGSGGSSPHWLRRAATAAAAAASGSAEHLAVSSAADVCLGRRFGGDAECV
jgi:hypothetical protein